MINLFKVAVQKMQWLTSKEWGCCLNNGPKLPDKYQIAHKNRKKAPTLGIIHLSRAQNFLINIYYPDTYVCVSEELKILVLKKISRTY